MINKSSSELIKNNIILGLGPLFTYNPYYITFMNERRNKA